MPLRFIEQQIENAQRRRLRERSPVADRSDASRTSALALTLGNQMPRAAQELAVHAEQRLAEAGAARIIVVDEQARARVAGQLRTLRGPPEGRLGLFACVNRDADVVPIAHEEQLRHLANGEREADDAVAAIVEGI